MGKCELCKNEFKPGIYYIPQFEHERIGELEAQLADRDKREGKLVTDLADLYEKYNKLWEAAAWYLECSKSWTPFSSYPLPETMSREEQMIIKRNREHEWWETIHNSHNTLRALLSQNP